jgi:hypothetical protein
VMDRRAARIFGASCAALSQTEKPQRTLRRAGASGDRPSFGESLWRKLRRSVAGENPGPKVRQTAAGCATPSWAAPPDRRWRCS